MSGLATRVVDERFCSRCGSALLRRVEGGRERPCCPACGHIVFGRFSIGVGGLLVHDGRVVFVQRAHEPGKGRWTLPGGFVEEDEAPDEAIVREVREETGLAVEAGPLLAIRHAQGSENQNAYFIFRLRLTGPASDLRIDGDGVEVSRALFVAPGGLDGLGELGMISRWAVERFAGGDAGLLRQADRDLPPPVPSHRWTVVYAAHAV